MASDREGAGLSLTGDTLIAGAVISCSVDMVIKKMKIAYIYLVIAIIAEVIGTNALKASEEFTKIIPSIVVVAGYGVAFYCMALLLRTLPVGIMYALWSGLGIVLITITGAIIYKEIPDIPAVIGISLIIAGVVIINLFSKSTVH